MGMEVGNAFKSGYNCSEAIVEAFRKYAGVNIDDNAFRLASGFGGGIGHAGILRRFSRLHNGYQYIDRTEYS
ncbi:MAG: C-GCAxxG-C-C family (seleno)protein [Phascolarctobacterium faecium]